MYFVNLQLFIKRITDIFDRQPSVRGILLTITSMFNMIGIFAMFFLGSITTWRNAALVGLTIPLLTLVVLTFVNQYNYIDLLLIFTFV